MGFTMTILALGNNRMFVCMTENTEEPGMLRSSCFERASDILMAGAAVFIGYFFAIGKCEWLMNLMALHAICKFLAFAMGLVAVHTVRFVSMFVVAE